MALKIIIILLCLWGVISEVTGITLVENGKPKSVIIIGNKSSGCVPQAARELQAYIKKISGSSIEIKTAPAETNIPLSRFTRGDNAILIGESSYTEKLNIPDKKLSSDGFQIKTFQGGLAIVGKDDKKFNMNYDRYPSSAGTLYGVYYFLEELGCRWFYPDPQRDIIPNLKTITIPEINIIRQPYFEYRFAYGNIPWRRKIGYGGTVDPWSTRHTFSQTINIKEKYGKQYPEILKKGFHFHHPGMIDIVVKEATAFFNKREPVGKKYFLVIPNDAYTGCNCSICGKLATPERGPEGTLSDYIGQAVVEVAEKLKQKGVQAGKVVYCAYEKYRLPPLKIKKLLDNVVVLMAASRAGFNDRNKKEKVWGIIDQWQRLSPEKYYFCRYYSGFLKLTPSFAPHLISEDIKRMKEYKENGKLNIGGEMNFGAVKPNHPYAWWFCLNEYVTAKLLWNPELSIDSLLQDYYDKFFGPASVPMKKFFTRLEKLYFTPKECYLYSVPVINELDEYLSKAKKLAKGTNYQKNVGFIDNSFNDIRMLRKKVELQSPSEIKEQKLAVYLPFDEGKGEITNDLARNKKCKIVNGKWIKGIKGSALNFSGNKSMVIMPRLSLATTDYSIEMWIKPKEITFNRLQYLIGPRCWDRHLLCIRNGKLNLLHRCSTGSYGISVTSISAETDEIKPEIWYYIVATFSKTNGMTLYVNGVLVAFDPAKKRPSDFGVNLIGAGGRKSLNDTKGFFNGCIDEVRIYRREMQPNEIKTKFLRYTEHNKNTVLQN